ncbi:MAG TPA: (2Fe-2S)-binding protein [Chiayiivirga sp.]|nr:(2Fe-2S)-binding protein [Chiayiivirga sp.]
MYVCICNGITDRDIRDAVRAGAQDLAQLSALTGCNTSCGSCGELAMEVLRETLREPLPLPMLAHAA